MTKALLKKMVRNDDADKYVALCAKGQAFVVKTLSNDGPSELVVYSREGAPQFIVGQRFRPRFEQLMREAGNNDGLWPGFDQTASGKSGAP
jgi:hypothetical protein